MDQLAWCLVFLFCFCYLIREGGSGNLSSLLWDFPCCVLDRVFRSEVGVVFRCEKNSKRVL